MRAAFETHWMEPIQPNRAVTKWLVDISSQTSYLFVIRGRAIIKPQPIRQRNNRLERLELDVCIIGGNEWEKATRADHGYFLEQKKEPSQGTRWSRTDRINMQSQSCKNDRWYSVYFRVSGETLTSVLWLADCWPRFGHGEPLARCYQNGLGHLGGAHSNQSWSANPTTVSAFLARIEFRWKHLDDAYAAGASFLFCFHIPRRYGGVALKVWIMATTESAKSPLSAGGTAKL